MAILQWRQNWEPFHDLERQVDRLLESMRFPLPALRLDRHQPPVNLYEMDEEFLLTARLPGTSHEQLDVAVNQGILTLKCNRPAPQGVADERFRRHERIWGTWQRSFTIPERVNEARVSAEFTDGLLLIHLPKIEEVKPRQIQVVATPA